MGILHLQPGAPAPYGIRVVQICPTCNAHYTSGSMCDACLRDADADASRKRAILFPADFTELT